MATADIMGGIDAQQPVKGDQRAVQDALASSPAVGQGEQPTSQAPVLVEDPPEDIKSALLTLVREYGLESDSVRRHKVKTFMQCEETYRGNQNIWWNEKDQQWHAFSEKPPGDDSEPPRYDYEVNVYRPWGKTVIAAMCTASPKLQFAPASAQSQDDVETAKQSSLVVDLVDRNNNLKKLRVKKAYYLWNQGIYATYIRYLVDGGLYGYHDEQEYGDQVFQVLPDRFECPQCGGYQSADHPSSAGVLAGGPVGCRQCGVMMGPQDFYPAEHVTATVPTGTKRVPNGAEKIDVYGPLMFKVPPEVDDQRQCYYFILCEEVHKAALRAAYPQKANEIDDVGSGGEDTYERIVRLGLKDAKGGWNTMPMSNLITYKRAWLRPMAFWAHVDAPTRSKLLKMFPDGVRVEFAGDVFLQAVPENVDDHWVITLGQEGQGMYRDPLGLDALSIQQQINDTANILAEHREMASAPPVLYDARYINGDALTRKRMMPASYTPVIIEGAGPQKPMAEMIFQPKLGVDPQLWMDTDRLTKMGEFIVGALPSLFGAGIPSLETASAYRQSRDQALGVLRPIAKAMNDGDAKEMTLAVECFQKNRTEDVELVVEGAAGGYSSKFIRLGMLRGKTTASPTEDDDFPQSWAEVRDTLNELLQSKDPEILRILGNPVNRPILKRYMGMPELVDPDDDNRTKQAIEIEALLQSEPTMDQTGNVRPSIMPEQGVDDDQVHIDVIKEWSVSAAGREAKVVNPAGYANVQAHRLAHLDNQQAVAADQMRRQSQVQAAAQPVPVPGAAPVPAPPQTPQAPPSAPAPQVQ